jgi:hypothetical protein
MQNKLVLTLWLVGAVLYAGSTVFLAHAVLGVGSSATPADKTKTATVATATDAQCQKDSVASGDAKPAKDADPQKTAAVDPKKPSPAPSAVKPAAPEASKPQASTPPAAGAEQDSTDQEPPAGDQQDQVLGPDGTPVPDGWQDQDAMGQGAGEGPAEPDEWASVVAGTADMRSEPSMQAPLVYALPAGWQVRVISRKPGWVQVQDANSAAAGWVESSAIAPVTNNRVPQGDPRFGGYDRRYAPYERYADETYPYGPPPPPWESPGRPFGDFLRRALGGF